MTALWTAPRTYTAGELITAAIMNTHTRDNLDFLKTPASGVDTTYGIATSSASLVDVTGSSFTFTSYGGGLDVFIFCGFYCTTLAAGVVISLNVDTVAVTSPTFTTLVVNNTINGSYPYHIAAMAAGSHTFKLQTSTSAGTATIVGYQFYVVERGS